MTYLLSEILLYLSGAAVLGALVGWLMRRSICNRDLADMQAKLDRSQTELNDKTAKLSTYEDQIAELQSKIAELQPKIAELQSKNELQSGELALMTSRWHSTLSQAKQLPNYQFWLEKVQNMYQQTRSERDEFADLAVHYVDMHADANQKIKRLNKRVTDQEGYKYRLDDMITKVSRLNSKVTSSENDIRDLYGMVAQVQGKWRNDRIDAAHLRAIHPQMEEQKNNAHWRLAELDKKYTEKFNDQQTQHQAEIEQMQKRINDQQTQHQTDIEQMQKRIDELTPLEGDAPGQDTTFNRFMDKIRLVGTSKNTVLGRAYKQIDETRRDASEKERVFVDTCEEKDAIIVDLREQIRTAENRAQAANSVILQKYATRIHELETELQSKNSSMAMLREHEHTLEAFKNKLAQKSTSSETMLREHKHTIEAFKNKLAQKSTSSDAMLREHEHTIEAFKNKLAQKPMRHIPQIEPVKPSRTRKARATKPSPKLRAGVNAPDKGLNIAAAKVKDDLKLIKGIGPLMEKKLNAFGVYSFEQLGKLTSKDIDTLTETLESFPGRIQRDKWVSQSKQQFKKKYGKSID